jgi:hypothetical protein
LVGCYNAWVIGERLLCAHQIALGMLHQSAELREAFF